MSERVVVTGAFGYSGQYIAQRLGMLVGDVVVTPEEVAGLMQTCSSHPRRRPATPA